MAPRKTLLAGLCGAGGALLAASTGVSAIGLIVGAVIVVFGAGALAYELLKRPGRRAQRKRHLRAAEAAEAGGEDGQLADVRAQPGPHPLPAGEGDQAALPQALALHRAAAARVPADLRRRQALLRQQQRHRLRARRRHRQGALGTQHRPPQRLLAGLLQAIASTSSTSFPATSSSSTPRPARSSGSTRCRAGPSPRRW